MVGDLEGVRVGDGRDLLVGGEGGRRRGGSAWSGRGRGRERGTTWDGEGMEC